MTDTELNSEPILLCSNCFTDEGLRLDAIKLGLEDPDQCPQCESLDGRKLAGKHIEALAHRFFVRGTTVRADFGAAPVIQWNQHHYGESTITPSPWLVNDIKLIEDSVKIGFFHYSPRLWMIGEIEPLKALQAPESRPQIIQRILAEYPQKSFAKDAKFYRLRVGPQRPDDPSEFDSPPIQFAGMGRLDSPGFPVMYGSQDVDICIHECRASIDDDVFVATLRTQKELRLLDLTRVLEEDVSEFESLDLAVHMLFLARSHSYDISRAIAIAAQSEGFDGVIYPSYFSLIRTGGYPFETSFGLSVRRFSSQRERYAEAFTIPNFALFGRPLEDGIVRVESINRLILTQVGYQGHFGPVTF
jgi:hypothetical protein